MSFSVTAKPAPRFDGDFSITLVDNSEPLAPKQAFLTQINGALDQLAADEVTDASKGYPTELLEMRRGARSATVKSLRDAADGLANGLLDAQTATDKVAAAQAQYRKALPKFGTAEAIPPRFRGDFRFETASALTSDEQKFIDEVKGFLKRLADDEASEPGGFSAGLVKARKEVREDAASKVRNLVRQVAAGGLDAVAAIEKLPQKWGGYLALRDRLGEKLFDIEIFKEEDDNKNLINAGFDLIVRSDLPPPHDTPSPDKQQLFNDINSAVTVVRVVCKRMREKVPWYKSKRAAALKTRSYKLHHEYIGKLANVAEIGLKADHTAFAQVALAGIKHEFVAQEAGRIKNNYVIQLGLWAGCAALVFLLAWWAITECGNTPKWWKIAECGVKTGWWYLHKSFLLAAAGAAIGTWLSFSARQVVLSFDQLLMMEERALDPPLRILFVIALTMTACLLFWTNTMNIEIGNLRTNAVAFQRDGSIAMLIGLFAGLSERALATAISGRAAAFVKTIGT